MVEIKMSEETAAELEKLAADSSETPEAALARIIREAVEREREYHRPADDD